MNDRALAQTAEALMRAVVQSGCIRRDRSDDVGLGVKVMREELKAFLFDGRYADERALTQTGQSGLAMQSLTANCIARITAERAA